MKIMTLIAATALLTGCLIQDKTGSEKTNYIARELNYFKDKHGICYATIDSYSYGANVVTSITTVPCEKIGL